MRRLISMILAIACILLAVAIMHRDVAPVQAIAQPHEGLLFEQSIADADALLDRPVRALSFDDLTLQQAVDALADLTKVNFVINWKALEGEGVLRVEQKRFAFHLRNVTLRQVLDSLTRHTNAGVAPSNLGYYVQNGVVFITTEADASKIFVTAFIDLRPLFEEIRRNRARWWFDHDSPATHQEIVDDVVKYVLDHVPPSGWTDDSGGTIREIEGILIVTRRPDNVREIRLLVERLHDAILSGTPLPATRPTTVPTHGP